MAEQFTIPSPDFEGARAEAGHHTSDGLRLLWSALNNEAKQRRRGVDLARNIAAWKVKTDAPGSQQDNYDLEGCSILHLNGSSARTFTGFRAPSTGESRILLVFVTGSATYTFNHASASSDAENRIRNQGLANLAVATDRSVIYVYLNALWRELKLV